MYVQYTTKDYLKFFNLPGDYSVDGVFVVGNWNVAGETGRVKKLIDKRFPAMKVKKLPAGFLTGGFELSQDESTVWFFVDYGGAKLSELLHIANLLGSKRNILTGLAGGLKKGIKAGDIIVPSKSRKDGSMSEFYSHDERAEHEAADESLTKAILEKLGGAAINEKTVTCQAMLAESKEMIDRWSEQGYAGVEMEAATVFAVSNHFNVQSAAMLVVSDNLIEDTTVLDGRHKSSRGLIDKSREATQRIALEVLFGN